MNGAAAQNAEECLQTSFWNMQSALVQRENLDNQQKSLNKQLNMSTIISSLSKLWNYSAETQLSCTFMMISCSKMDQS